MVGGNQIQTLILKTLFLLACFKGAGVLHLQFCAFFFQCSAEFDNSKKRYLFRVDLQRLSRNEDELSYRVIDIMLIMCKSFERKVFHNFGKWTYSSEQNKL